MMLMMTELMIMTRNKKLKKIRKKRKRAQKDGERMVFYLKALG